MKTDRVEIKQASVKNEKAGRNYSILNISYLAQFLGQIVTVLVVSVIFCCTMCLKGRSIRMPNFPPNIYLNVTDNRDVSTEQDRNIAELKVKIWLLSFLLINQQLVATYRLELWFLKIETRRQQKSP